MRGHALLSLRLAASRLLLPPAEVLDTHHQSSQRPPRVARSLGSEVTLITHSR